MITFKKINIKDPPYYFISEMINIKKLDPNFLNIDKISIINSDYVTYYIKYITTKSLDYVKIDFKNSLYLFLIN